MAESALLSTPQDSHLHLQQPSSDRLQSIHHTSAHSSLYHNQRQQQQQSIPQSSSQTASQSSSQSIHQPQQKAQHQQPRHQQQQQHNQQQQQQQQQQDPRPQQEHDQQLENMTFLMQQDISSPSSRPGHAHLTEAEEELNIYDYIHAKQDDEEEASEDQSMGRYSHSKMSTPQPATQSSSHTSITSASSGSRPPPPPPPPPPRSCVPMSMAMSMPSSSAAGSTIATNLAPIEVSAVPVSTSAPLNKGIDQVTDMGSQLVNDNSLQNIMSTNPHTHMDHSVGSQGGNDYMDPSMDIYGSSNSSFMPPYSDLISPPTQDLFRMLMEELQAQAAIQRERFFASTTGDSTMDSVDFLFNGQQARPVPHFMIDPSMIDSPNLMATTPESCLGSPAHADHHGHHCLSSIADPVPIQLDSTMNSLNSHQTNDHLQHQQHQYQNQSQNQNQHHPQQQQHRCLFVDESTMTPTSSMGFSSSSTCMAPHNTEPYSSRRFSGVDRYPKQVSDASTSTYCDSQEAGSSMTTATSTKSISTSTSTFSPMDSTSSPVIRPEVVRVAFTKISSHSSLTTYSGPQENSVSELSLNSPSDEPLANKPVSAKRKNATRPAMIATSTTPSSWKKPRLDDRLVDETEKAVSPQELSSISPSVTHGSLPSPPSSVRTTPPLAPVRVGYSLEEESASFAHGRPVSPTSPLPPISSVASAIPDSHEYLMDNDDDDDTVESSKSGESTMEADQATSQETSSSLAAKRPWTPEEEAKLLELLKTTKPIREVAKILNRSIHSVRSRRQVLTDPGFVKGHGHSQPRRSRPDPGSKLPTYSQMAFLSLARLPDHQGALNDVADMVEKLFSRHLNRIPRTGHKNLQIWRAQISDALAHEKSHPRPRFESFGLKRGRQWVYRLTEFGRGVAEAMGGVDKICDDLLKNNEMAVQSSSLDESESRDGQSTGA
ncbi:hypothetical protein BGZ94_002806, partial [Podila epigama]